MWLSGVEVWIMCRSEVRGQGRSGDRRSQTGDGFVICEMKRPSKPSGVQNPKRRTEEEKKKSNIKGTLCLLFFDGVLCEDVLFERAMLK